MIILIWLIQQFHRDYVCLMSPNKDETRSQSVAGTAVDGHVFSLVQKYNENEKYNWNVINI